MTNHIKPFANIKLRHNRAFTLIELMIAMFLGLVITLAAGNLLVANKSAYIETERFARFQENARFTLDRMRNAVDNAGYFDAYQYDQFINMKTILKKFGNKCFETVTTKDFFKAYTPDLPSDVKPCLGSVSIPQDSDVIITKNVRPAKIEDIAGGDTINTALYNLNNTNFVYFAVQSHKLAGFFDANGALPFSPPASTYQYDPTIYYVAPAGSNDDTPTLWRRFYNGSSVVSEAMVEGVEAIRVMLRVCDMSDPAICPRGYQTPTQVEASNKWDQVISAQIYFLMRTEAEPGYKDKKIYTLGANNKYGPKDDNFRRFAQSITFKMNEIKKHGTD